MNALNYIQPGYGEALDWMKEWIDRGHDVEDVRPGAASDIGAAQFGAWVLIRVELGRWRMMLAFVECWWWVWITCKWRWGWCVPLLPPV